ncbi:PAS domain S-box protein [Endothiovibrio diazotrophicus]
MEVGASHFRYGEEEFNLAPVRDISEREQADEESALERVDRVLLGSRDLDRMSGRVLDTLLDLFACERASVIYPFDPDAPVWRVLVERCRPGYAGVRSAGGELPTTPQIAAMQRACLALDHPLSCGAGSDHPVPEAFRQRFGDRALLTTILRPDNDRPWGLSLIQCDHDRRWSVAEIRLFEAIGRRLSAALTTLLELRELRESENKYRRIVDTASEGVWGIDAGHHTTFVNARMAEMLGYSRQEMMGRRVEEFLFEEELADHRQRMENRREGGNEQYERRFRRADGGELWALVSATSVRDDEGRLRGSFAMLTDITERKRMEQALRTNEQRYRDAQFIGRVGNWEYNLQSGRFWGSDEAKRLYGFDPQADAFSTDEVESCIPERERVHQALVELIENDREYDIEFEIRPRNGAEPRILASVARLQRDGQGNPLKVAGVVQDITARKQAGEALQRHKEALERTVEERTAQLRQARDAARAASQAKSLFLANMSHELRTPLNAILGFSNLMRREAGVTPAQAENLDIINRSGEHLLQLINDVLEIAKIESGRLQLEIAPFDLGALVREVIDLMRLRAEQKGLYLRLDQSSAFPRYIEGDEARLRQILINLVGNAVKFTERGGVNVRLGVKDNARHRLLIEVEDSGPGIAPEERRRLFEPFVQTARGSAKGGTGLGLAITRQFVELMGGVIGVESRPGEGSCFRIDLPLASAKGVEPPATEASPGEVIGLLPGQPAFRILIAEDHAENRLLLVRLMEALGLAVRVAGDGEQCVRLFREWRPDLIWMDRRMPVLDGVAASRRIRALPGGERVKIVAVTASVFKEEQPELAAAGIDDLVCKPYRPAEIYACLAHHLGLRYRYREAVAMPSAEAPTPALLARLEVPLRERLREAAEQLDCEGVEALVARVGEREPELARALHTLAERFDYPAILKALEGVERDD